MRCSPERNRSCPRFFFIFASAFIVLAPATATAWFVKPDHRAASGTYLVRLFTGATVSSIKVMQLK